MFDDLWEQGFVFFLGVLFVEDAILFVAQTNAAKDVLARHAISGILGVVSAKTVDTKLDIIVAVIGNVFITKLILLGIVAVLTILHINSLGEVATIRAQSRNGKLVFYTGKNRRKVRIKFPIVVGDFEILIAVDTGCHIVLFFTF
ncbi:MAG: hypothetical protein WC897_06160 [Candidatus Gracilibacteria bacterium]